MKSHWVILVVLIVWASACSAPSYCPGVMSTGTRIPKKVRKPKHGLFPRKMMQGIKTSSR